MRCEFCPTGTMRLVRFEAGREIWQCRNCSTESLVLDCGLCEQRSVRRVPDHHGSTRWACSRCQVDQYPCQTCGRGWVRDLAGSWLPCDRCGASWNGSEAS